MRPQVEMLEAEDSVVELTAVPPLLQERLNAQGYRVAFISEDRRSTVQFTARGWRAVSIDEIEEMGRDVLSEVLTTCEDPKRNYGTLRRGDMILVCATQAAVDKWNRINAQRAAALMGQTNTISENAEELVGRSTRSGRRPIRIQTRGPEAEAHVVGGKAGAAKIIRNDEKLKEQLKRELEEIPD